MAVLLDVQELAEAGLPEAVRIPLELVDPNPSNPRQQLVDIEALAENVRTFGLLQPVTVRRRDERYELLSGHRRRAAFDYLREHEPLEPQWRTIPAVVRTSDDDDERDYLRLISAQIHNRSWQPREEAAALEVLVRAGRTLTQVGELLHRDRSWASKRLRTYADDVLAGYVLSGKLPATVAEELLVVRNAARRNELAQRAADEGWSQSDARAQVRALDVIRQTRAVGRLSRDLLKAIQDLGPDDFSPADIRSMKALLDELRRVAQRPRRGEKRPTFFPPLPNVRG